MRARVDRLFLGRRRGLCLKDIAIGTGVSDGAAAALVVAQGAGCLFKPFPHAATQGGAPVGWHEGARGPCTIEMVCLIVNHNPPPSRRFQLPHLSFNYRNLSKKSTLF